MHDLTIYKALHSYMCLFYRNRVKGPAREIDTGGGFFIEEGGEEDNTELKVVHPEGKSTFYNTIAGLQIRCVFLFL